VSIEENRTPSLTLNPAFAFAVGAKQAIKTRIVRSTRRNLGRFAARVALDVRNMVWQTKNTRVDSSLEHLESEFGGGVWLLGEIDQRFR
jgi:hypothetical protein